MGIFPRLFIRVLFLGICLLKSFDTSGKAGGYPSQPKKILITGANGWIGYNAYLALKNYHLVLVDNKVGKDSRNRFGLEETDQENVTGLQDKIIKIDFAGPLARLKFERLLEQEKPDCVLHLAGILENQPVKEIKKNYTITNTVLESCVQKHVKMIVASSIMIMYGAALKDKSIKPILFGNQETKPDQTLTVDTPLENSAETILSIAKEHYKQCLSYIRTKEYLEEYAKKLISKHLNQTIVIVRFGWTGIKNPYEMERNTQIKENTVYLAPEDLQDFLIKVVEAVVKGHIAGYKKYIAVSEHPQRWVDIKNAKEDLKWEPKINIKKRYNP